MENVKELSIEVDETLFMDEDYKTAYETLREQYLKLQEVSYGIENANENQREREKFILGKLTDVQEQVKVAEKSVRQFYKDFVNDATLENKDEYEDKMWGAVVEMNIALKIVEDLISRRDADE